MADDDKKEEKTEAKPAASPSPVIVQLPPEVMAKLDSLMARHGGAEPTAAMLFSENKEYRDRIRELEKLVPKEDQVLISKTEYEAAAAAQSALAELGGLEKVREALTQKADLETKLVQRDRDDLLREVADATHFKFSVLKDRDASTPGLEYEVKDDGKGHRTAYVKVKDSDSGNVLEKPLTDYAKESWTDYLPALSANGTNGKAPLIPDLDANKRSNGLPGFDPEQARLEQAKATLRSF